MISYKSMHVSHFASPLLRRFPNTNNAVSQAAGLRKSPYFIARGGFESSAHCEKIMVSQRPRTQADKKPRPRAGPFSFRGVKGDIKWEDVTLAIHLY